MPVRSKAGARRNTVPEFADELDLDLGWPERTDEEMAPLWEKHRDYMMERAVEMTPGTRPVAFYVFDAGILPPRVRDEADVLFEMGEMDAAELAAVRAMWRGHEGGPKCAKS